MSETTKADKEIQNMSKKHAKEIEKCLSCAHHYCLLDLGKKCPNVQKIDESKQPRKIPVDQLTADGVFIRRYHSAKEASEALNCSTYSIYKVLNGKNKTCFGFKWRYATI